MGLEFFVFFVLFLLPCSADDFRELQRFVARLADTKNFEMVASDGDRVSIGTVWQSKDGYVLYNRIQENSDQDISEEFRRIFNPFYLANLTKENGRWQLVLLYDHEHDAHKLNSGPGGENLLLGYGISPRLSALLNPNNFRDAVKVSEEEIEYFISPESEFFSPLKGCDKVTIRYAKINNELLPVSIESWTEFQKNKPGKELVELYYPTGNPFPIEVTRVLSQTELGLNMVEKSTISLIDPKDFRFKNDNYLSGYDLPEFRGVTQRLGWVSWLWIAIAIAISSRLIWYFISNKKR